MDEEDEKWPRKTCVGGFAPFADTHRHTSFGRYSAELKSLCWIAEVVDIRLLFAQRGATIAPSLAALVELANEPSGEERGASLLTLWCAFVFLDLLSSIGDSHHVSCLGPKNSFCSKGLNAIRRLTMRLSGQNRHS